MKVFENLYRSFASHSLPQNFLYLQYRQLLVLITLNVILRANYVSSAMDPWLRIKCEPDESPNVCKTQTRLQQREINGLAQPYTRLNMSKSDSTYVPMGIEYVFPGLEVLDASYNYITSRRLFLYGLGHLKELNLRGNKVECIYTYHFEDCVNLQTLDLRKMFEICN
jgi:hypothetical protein